MNENPRSEDGEKDVPLPEETDSEDSQDMSSPEISFPSPEEMDAFLSDYEVREILGQGGMGAVYLGWQPRLGRSVAIKVLRKDLGETSTFAQQFHAEARTMANLHHSHIATVHDFGESEGFHYLIMEHVDGTTLFDHYYAGNFTPSEIITVILQVCDALDYAHSHGVIHRDIKSANILVGQDGMAKIVDFGLATFQATGPGLLRRRKDTGPNYGTRGFSAPEMFRAGAHVDHRTDIYSLAVVLYEGLTGKTMVNEWTPPSQFEGVPPGVDQIILTATKHDPRERYQNIDAFATALRQLGQGTQPLRAITSSKAAAATARAARKAAALRHHPTSTKPAPRFPVVPIALIVACLAVSAYFILRDEPEPAAPEPGKTPARKTEIVVTGLDDDQGADIAKAGTNPKPKPESDPEADPEMIFSTLPPPEDPLPDPDPLVEADPIPEPEDAPPPAAVVEIEASLASEMAELDALFATAYQVLATKYAGALERKRADADAAGKEALDAEIALMKAGSRPAETDAADLSPVVAGLRPALRAEYAKLAAPDAEARIALLKRHIETLRSLSTGIFAEENAAMEKALKTAIAKHQDRIAALDEIANPRLVRKSGEVAIAHRQITLGTNGSEILAPRGTGLGIFAGLHGRINDEGESLSVSPETPDGNWDLIRESTHDFLYVYGLYYQSPHLDFTKARLEAVEWKGADSDTRLISGDRGFSMISGVAGRIGAGTEFSMRYDPDNHFWSGKGVTSENSTRIFVTNVDMGNAMLNLRTEEFSWKANEPEMKLIHKDAGFCVLTALAGPFNGGGERLQLRINDKDGYWYLGGQTGDGGVSATATAFLTPK